MPLGVLSDDEVQLHEAITLTGGVTVAHIGEERAHKEKRVCFPLITRESQLVGKDLCACLILGEIKFANGG